MDTKDMYDIRLALNCAIEPEAPKAQAPSPTCPFIKINYVKERADKFWRTLIHPDLNQGEMSACLSTTSPAPFPKKRCCIGEAALYGRQPTVNL
jgi:hypothetical protein